MMSKEGEVSHIPTIIVTMYLVIGAFSMLCSYCSGDAWYTIPAYYLSFMLAFYVWHWMAHQKWTGIMNELHMDHHLNKFPPNDFYGDKNDMIMKDYGKKCPTMWDLCNPFSTIVGDIRHEGPIYVFMVIILVGGRFVLETSTVGYIFVSILLLAMGIIGNAMHMSFHIRDFELQKYAWYRELRMLHYIHHLGDMKSNLAMVNLGMDGLFNSLTLDDPLRKNKKFQNMPAAPGLRRMDSMQSDHIDKLEELPDGMDHEMFEKIRDAAGLQAMALGFDVDLDIKPAVRTHATKRGYPTVLLRVVLMAVSIYAFVATEKSLADLMSYHGYGEPLKLHLSDYGHKVLSPVREWLQKTNNIEPACYISQMLDEIAVLIMCYKSITGKTFRPVLACIFGLLTRLLCRFVTQAPMTDGSLWHVPKDLPVLFANPETSNVFFSARVIIATIFMCESVYSVQRLVEDHNNFEHL